MIRLLLLLTALLLTLPGRTQSLDTRSIPPNLKDQAHAVIRFWDESLEVRPDGRVRVQVHYAVTILDRQGDNRAACRVYYDEKLGKVQDFTGTLYDAQGREVRKLKKAEISDMARFDGFSLFTSSRVQVAEMRLPSYPFTVAYSYAYLEDFLYYTTWLPLRTEATSLERASLTLVLPPDKAVAHRARHFDPVHRAETIGNRQQLRWESGPIPAIRPDPLSGAPLTYLPHIRLQPQVLAFGGVSTDGSSWEGMGRFFYELNKDRDSLPPDLYARIRALTADIADPYTKIEVLYRYMQSQTRYVSVQLGIGGMQTFPASYVYDNGYGDCKALSNYMKGMLDVVGIEAYTALVRAEQDAYYLEPDFVHDPFNHVILCAVLPGSGGTASDTVWLECTSSTLAAGFLGNFTSDRPVLLCTPEGGRLVRTPPCPAIQNQQRRLAEVRLDRNGSAQVAVSMAFTGTQYDPPAHAQRASRQEQEAWLKRRIPGQEFTLTRLQFGDPDQRIGPPSIAMQYDLQVPRWATVSGPRLFVPLGRLVDTPEIPPAAPGRTQDLWIDVSWADYDTMLFALPENYTIESTPQTPVQVQTPFGVYETHIEWLSPTLLRFTRRLEQYKGRHPADQYEAYRSFLRTVQKGDQTQVVLSSKS